MASIEPLPSAWRAAVVRVLEQGATSRVRWSFRARQDWQQFGLPYEAYTLLIRSLSQPEVWGERISGMDTLPAPPANSGSQTIYAFLCPHPLGFDTPLYAKIGLFADHVTIDLFSLHIDLTGNLRKRIARVRKTKR